MEWLSLVLGAGGVAFIGTLGKAIQVLLDRREARTAKMMNELERSREDAREDAAWYVDLGDYWRNRAGDLEYQVRANGMVPVEAKPLPERPAPRIQEK